MRKYFPWYIFLAVLAILFLPRQPNLWLSEYITGCVICLGILSVAVYRKTNCPVAAVAFFYFTVRACFSWAGLSPFPNWGQVLSANSFGLFAVVAATTLILSAREREMAWRALALACVISAAILTIRRLSGGIVWSFMNNAAADAAIIAVLLPVLFMRKIMHIPHWLVIAGSAIALTGIIASGSSTGALGLVAAGFAVTVALWNTHRLARLAVIAAVAIAGTSLLFFREAFLNDNGRWMIWKLSTEYFLNPEKGINQWIGAGAGSFFAIGPHIELENQYLSNNIFLFLHNDYLQACFEYGYVGVFLLLAVGVCALRKSFDRPWLFAALFTYGVTMATQYHLRYFPSELIGALLLVEAFSSGKEGAA